MCVCMACVLVYECIHSICMHVYEYVCMYVCTCQHTLRVLLYMDASLPCVCIACMYVRAYVCMHQRKRHFFVYNLTMPTQDHNMCILAPSVESTQTCVSKCIKTRFLMLQSQIKDSARHCTLIQREMHMHVSIHQH
jgi:hypothetical protein